MKEMDTYMLSSLPASLAKITIYTGVVKDEIVNKYSSLIRLLIDQSSKAEELMDSYHQVLSMLIQRYGFNGEFSGDLWKNHLINLILADENVFSMACERGEYADIPEGLLNIVKSDLLHLHSVFRLDGIFLRDIIKARTEINELPNWELRPYNEMGFSILDDNGLRHVDSYIIRRLYSSECWGQETRLLNEYYYQQGCGIFNRFRAFRWVQTNDHEGFLEGVEKPDPIRLKDLIGYERERSLVIQNTLQFVKGLPCNNILLYGDRGTGKSASVKAILNEYASCRLRLVEVSKYHLNNLPKIMEVLQKRGLNFILFIDDLSFESDETSYRELKSVLEGGIEAKPRNVVIYATSNRRHLIKEYFSERSLSDEVSSQDTMQEKLSLSDRFGITVTFSLPDKETYLKIVEGLARQRRLNIDPDELKAEAVKWEMFYNGRSPRTARQFIDHMEGKLKFCRAR
ncbi:MAG: ATP-binding protein [Caldicoprobacterales bacterium]|jgi:predicted AAA+ superfamily ATPase|nr:ATP-binding protein [Clostridiales bacterium]